MALLYLPAARLMLVYVGFSSGRAEDEHAAGASSAKCSTASWLLFLTGIYLIGAAALSVEYRRTEDPIVRQQLKWLRNGAFCGILPFALFYVLPVLPGHGSERLHEDVGAVAGAGAADAGLRHHPLPADGRRHPLPPRLRLHAGDALRAGGLLRDRLLPGEPGAEEFQGSGAERPGGHHADGGVPVPAGAQLDSGAPGPLLLSRPL